MSHEIESVNGRASMVFAGETPWHGLGHRLQGDESADQIREMAGLNWNVEVEPLYRKIDGEFVEFPHRRSLPNLSGVISARQGVYPHAKDSSEPEQSTCPDCPECRPTRAED